MSYESSVIAGEVPAVPGPVARAEAGLTPVLGAAARRLNVLVSAYSCSPTRGSEPGIGWNWVLANAYTHNVWVVTSREFEREIRAHLAEHPQPNVRWVFHDVFSGFHGRRRSTFLQHLHYYVWQLSTYRLLRRLHRQVRFDALHHATLTIFWRPSALAFVDAPLVWGPLGGAETSPRALRPTLSVRSRLFEAARNGAQSLSSWDPLLRLTARRATLALAATTETAERLRQMGAGDVRVMESVGMTDAELGRLGRLPHRTGGPFRVLSAGVLVGWKGFHLGLEAFARLHREHPESEYWILGDGPERANLEELALRLGVAGRVRFWRNVSRDRVLEILGDCDVMMHPSMHDSGCYATLEAMAAGRPVVCLDVGGPARQVTEETGFKVAAGAPAAVVDALARALLTLRSDPELRTAMGVAGRRRVATDFHWRTKATAVDAWLADACDRVAPPGAPREALAT